MLYLQLRKQERIYIMISIEHIEAQVKEIAKLAGKFMKEGTIQTIETKSDIANIVTDMDVKTQAFIIEKLTPLIEGATIFAEEKENQVLSDEYTWIIDPIDGTTNYAYDFHHSAISIALAKDKEPILGVCYNPYLDELFYGRKGHGAFMNGTQLHVGKNALASSLIMCGTAPYNKGRAEVTFTCMKELFLHGRDIRRSGSAVLDLCYVAAGRVDAFYEDQLSFWDYAAASLLVQEAGGNCLTMYGHWGDMNPIGFIAGNVQNHKELHEVVKPFSK